MKHLTYLGMLSGLLLNSTGFALNPIQGFYVGILGEVSHGPSEDQVIFHEDNMNFLGTVDYSPISGGGGAYLGYKLGHFRLEGEVLYNRISTGPLTVGSCTLQSPNVFTPTGTCPPGEYDHFRAKALGYQGSSAATYGFVNAFYDFFSWEGDTPVVPYVGLGVGKAQVTNRSNFVDTITSYSHGQSTSDSHNAFQGILGLSYYMDDFAWASMDYRYLSTQSNREFQNKSYILNTINFTVNFAFDKGGINFNN